MNELSARRNCVYVAVVLMLSGYWMCTAAPQSGDSPPPDPRDALIRDLNAKVDAQTRQLQAFEQRLAAAEHADVNAARVEQLRQQIREILSEEEFRSSLMPTAVQAGYDNGFYMVHPGFPGNAARILRKK